MDLHGTFDEVLALAGRLRQLDDDFAALGLSISPSVHGVGRETFDAIPGVTRRIPTTDERGAFWTKRHEGIIYFTNFPPVELES